MQITQTRPLVLGSASPRRRELLGRLGVPFVVLSPDADETLQPRETPGAYAERVVLAKLAAVRGLAPDNAAAILVADTIVVAPDGGVLGKPRDDADARAMIARLAGATHQVSTRFVLAPRDPSDPQGFRVAHAQTVTTRVTFRPLAPQEIDAYVATGEGRDKAGAYAVQGDAAALVERIDGSFTGVIGLPLSEVSVALRGLGWPGR